MGITMIEDISFLISLIRLDLSGNSFTSSKSVSSLRHLPSLTWLNLSNCGLTDIDGACQIQTLTVLNVSKNLITQIPSRVLTMIKLQALIATDNQISHLPRLPSSLDALVLSRNRISTFENILWPLEHLKKLSVSQNQLFSPPDVSRCSSLKELRLSDNKISTLKESKLPTGLMILEIGKNCIASLEDLTPVLLSRSIRSLNITGNPFVSSETAIVETIKSRMPLLNSLNGKTVRERKNKRGGPSK